VLEKVLRRCTDAGLVGGEGFAVDASVVTLDIDFKKTHKGEASNNIFIAAVSHYVI